MAEQRPLRTHPEISSHLSLQVFRSLGENPKSRIERLLPVFAGERAGEGMNALLLTINIYPLPGARCLLKQGREALILSESGAEVKSYSSAGQAVLLLGIIPFYGRVPSQVNRQGVKDLEENCPQDLVFLVFEKQSRNCYAVLEDVNKYCSHGIRRATRVLGGKSGRPQMPPLRFETRHFLRAAVCRGAARGLPFGLRPQSELGSSRITLSNPIQHPIMDRRNGWDLSGLTASGGLT